MKRHRTAMYMLRKVSALLLSGMILITSVLVWLPDDILMKAWADEFVFAASGHTAQPCLKGSLPGEKEDSWFLCLNREAAFSDFSYDREYRRISYTKGNEWEKQLFWAYLCAFGSADGDTSVERYRGIISGDEAGQTALKLQIPAQIEQLAKDGFMQLETIPDGCENPERLYELVSSHGTPGTALKMEQLKFTTDMMDGEKLARICGLDSWETFQRYVSLEPVRIPEGLRFVYNYTDQGIEYHVVDSEGNTMYGSTDVLVRAVLHPAFFKLSAVSGTIEYLLCGYAGAQQLARVNAHLKESSPVFYLSASELAVDASPKIDLTRYHVPDLQTGIYEHKETFTSHYNVDLYQYDAETGIPVENAGWQVLGTFADEGKRFDMDQGGIALSEIMHFWNGWMILENGLKTDADGHIRYTDTHTYDFEVRYCDGHPEPDINWGRNDEENEALWDEWRGAMQACNEMAMRSDGTFYHWESGYLMPDRASEETCFEESGAKAARDKAYETYVNLRYSYTFREENARDGYILHGKSGEEDDEPAEVITTAASEAGGEYVLETIRNQDIRDTQYLRDFERLTDPQEELDDESDMMETEVVFYEPEETSWTDPVRHIVSRMVGIMDEENGGEPIVITLRQPRAMVASMSDAEIICEEAADEEDAEDSVLTATGEAGSSAAVPVYHYDYEQNTLQVREPELFSNYVVSNDMSADAWADDIWSDAWEDAWKIKMKNAFLDDQPPVEAGAPDTSLYTWNVYAHRVPGEISFNVRDRELRHGETENYDSYADTQGDASLEGAVFGLFASDDIYGPDTQRDEYGAAANHTTGVIFDADDLVAVATTDADGNGVFRTITEKPHSIYDYDAGEIRETGKAYPGNLCGGWIGRPLILGNYYIRGLARSEGYEISVNSGQTSMNLASGKNQEESDPSEASTQSANGTVWIKEPLSSAGLFSETLERYGNTGNLLTVTVASKDMENGYDVIFDGVPETAQIYFDQVETRQEKVQVPDGGRWEGTGEYRTARSEYLFKLDENGNRIENPDASYHIPKTYYAYATLPNTLEDQGEAVPPDVSRYYDSYSDEMFLYVKATTEHMMRQLGIETPSWKNEYSTEEHPIYDEYTALRYGNPEIALRIENATTNASLIETILDYFMTKKIFCEGSVQQISFADGTAEVKLAIGMTPHWDAFYETDNDGNVTTGYLWRLDPEQARYVLRKYAGNALFIRNGIGPLGKKLIQFLPEYVVSSGSKVEAFYIRQEMERYFHYQPGEILYEYFTWSGDELVGHNPVEETVYIPEYREEVREEEEIHSIRIRQAENAEEFKELSLSGESCCYYNDASGQWILHVGAADMELSGRRDYEFTLALPDGIHKLTEEDIAVIGADNVWKYRKGTRIPESEYLLRIAGAGAGAASAAVTDPEQTDLCRRSLVYKGGYDFLEDGNTGELPAIVTEQVVRQNLSARKCVDSAGSDEEDSIVPAAFQIYLKSNLQALYRDPDGNVVWLDGRGVEHDAEEELAYKNNFPEAVRRIRTKGMEDGSLLEGYTAVLEKLNGDRYNYAKFFDALNVADRDQWEMKAPTMTMWPSIRSIIERLISSLTGQEEQPEVSDAVRQFAIDWYLDENPDAESDVFQDADLPEAIKKAEDYLKPFYKYDLNAIYAIESEFSEDAAEEFSEAFRKDGTGRWNLPYGTYLVAERNSGYAEFAYGGDDFGISDRIYQSDSPQEVMIPTEYPVGDAEAVAVFSGQLYVAYLCMESRDSGTDGALLKDGTVFTVYAAESENVKDSNGAKDSSKRVRFYDTDTQITGSREFLEAMRAFNIRSIEEDATVWDNLMGKAKRESGLCTGTVPSGTPVCAETEELRFYDPGGKEQPVFAIYHADGYLETSQPLASGTYVIAETGTPTGYVRTAPIAVEIYSDQITYYKNGNPDTRVLAAIYGEKAKTGTSDEGQLLIDHRTARIPVENTPIRLKAEIQNSSGYFTDETTGGARITSLISGRVDGTYREIGDRTDLVHAYENGKDLGYAWKKGMLEYLTARKQAGEDVEIVYNGSVFAGYGYVTRRAEASALESSYASGETVALYEAIPVAVSGAGDASGCQKAVAERDFSGRVTRMYLRDGDSGEETDILYYDLTGLDLWTSDWLDGIRRDYLYDRDHQRISADEAEKIRSSMETAGAEYSVYGFLGEVPYLEITGGDLTSLQYAVGTGRITAEDSMQIYHLDANGNRDARIDPANGMAYVMNENDAESERTAESVLVWPVYIHRDENGKITETKKLQSYRLNASEPEEEDIVLSGVAAGTYIMEEMIEPDGYRKGMPTGITVQETTKLQKVSMTNTVTKIELALLDGDDSAEEEKLAGYSYAPVPGAVLALYDACRIYTSNTKKYPKGYYLSKTSADPVSYRAVDDSSGQQFTEALWTTGVTPLYLEGIPAGDYILEELQFPEGYEKSTPMEIEIRNQNTVQQYWMYSEHTEPKMLISKTLQSARGELTGVSMALYRATEDGKLQMLPEYLEDAWITGEDGVYTEEDQQKDHIADGYVPGDRKPHEVSDLESGIYWLAELQSPAYLKAPEPMQIVYTRKKSRQLFRSESAMVEASLKIAKTDPDAKPLTGAVYQLSAFRPADSEHPVFEKEVSGAEAAIEIKGLPVGEIAYRSTSAGIAQEPYVIPYTYQLKEILPPQSYCVNPAFYRWRFPENQDGASYRREDMACKEITIMNDITRIPIGRKEWVRADEEACYVPGTQAAVYEITGRDAAGNPEYSKEHPYWIWTLQEDREEILKGLTAGHSYVLLEEAVPDGHPLMQPVIFTISEDGTMISELYAIGNGGELSWKTEAEDAEHIRLSSVAGRYVLSTEMVLLDEAGQELTRWYVHAQEHLFIRPKSYVDGDCVTVQEIVHYSDGTGQTIRQEKRSLIFDENGICRIPCRKASDMILRLLDASGQEIVSFSPGPGRWEFLTEEADEMLYFPSEGYYVLAEMTVFSDGEETMTGNVRIFPDKRMEPEKTEEKTTVELLKTENTGGMLLPGCELELQTADGESVAQWISGNEPKIMENILVAGEKYVLIEKKPAPGYAYAEPVPFTVSKGTSTDRIFMEDKPTVVEIGTALGSPGSYLSGVLMQILDETGNICESWVSSGETYLVTARLHAGENYILREMKSPARYKKGEDIRFTVPNDGTKLTLWMINQRKITNSSEHGRTEEEPKVKIKTTGWITASYYPVLTWIGTGEWRDGIRIMSRTGQNPGNGQIRTETGKTGESTRNGMNLQLHSGESTQSGENPDSWEARMSRTGDSGRTALYLVLAVLSLLGMTIIFWQKKMTKDRRFDIMDSVRKNKRKKRDLSGDPSEEADNR